LFTPCFSEHLVQLALVSSTSSSKAFTPASASPELGVESLERAVHVIGNGKVSARKAEMP